MNNIKYNKLVLCKKKIVKLENYSNDAILRNNDTRESLYRVNIYLIRKRKKERKKDNIKSELYMLKNNVLELCNVILNEV